MNHHLGELVGIATDRGWPMPSAIVGNKSNVDTGVLDGEAGDGFVNAASSFGYDVPDPASFISEQQKAMFAWAHDAPDDLGLEEVRKGKGGKLSGPRLVQFFGPGLPAISYFGGSA